MFSKTDGAWEVGISKGWMLEVLTELPVKRHRLFIFYSLSTSSLVDRSNPEVVSGSTRKTSDVISSHMRRNASHVRPFCFGDVTLFDDVSSDACTAAIFFGGLPSQCD